MNFRKCFIIPNESEMCSSMCDISYDFFNRDMREKYNCAEEYLNRQFYLLREDCFCHLKLAIRKFRTESINPNKTFSSDMNVWIYKNVQFSEFSFHYDEIVYEIKFESNDCIDWEDNRRLRYGSLLYLSSNNFRTYIVSTVSDSNTKDLKNGSVKIQLLNYPFLSNIDKKMKYIMLESQAYFEFYTHALKRIQKLHEKSFPFADYILYNQITPKIERRRVIDFYSNVTLNKFQDTAYRLAVTQNITLIQGPPGTGKTTVGVAIVQNLLECLNNRILSKPILIVCYTNHALDQLLEKILKFSYPGRVIRIGSKSESEEMKKCNIKLFVNEWKSRKRFPKHLAFEKSSLFRQLNSMKKEFLQKKELDIEISAEEANAYLDLLKRLKELKMVEHKLIMESAQVIGMTTTACTRYSDVLDDIGIEVMIVEEAAQLMEAHVLCSINSNCTQLIMIGDHKQLTPSNAVFEISEYFECSLFERLIKIGFPFVTLNEQRRMRPEISVCISSLYPLLENHFSMSRYPNVRGLRTNVYFFHHVNPEQRDLKTSFKNDYEVEFVKAMCHFLMDRGVDKDKITILSTYKGQDFIMKEKVKKVKSFVVDGYQGDENDIIILSLVRSNREGKIGYLKKENRMCVALSRARHGMFVVGNFEMLKNYSIWKNLLEIQNENCGSSVPISCKRNENHDLYIDAPWDFYEQNLCKKKCEKPFPCKQHFCQLPCHEGDHDYCETVVMKTCNRNLHSTELACSQVLRCESSVKAFLKCGHVLEYCCHEDTPINCQEMVMIQLNCSHSQIGLCGTDKSRIVCDKIYKQTLKCGHPYFDCKPYSGLCVTEIVMELTCQHKKSIKCCQKNYPVKCSSVCSKILPCGHLCLSSCEDCLRGRLHKSCQTKCSVFLICGHNCKDLCHSGYCSSCSESCLISRIRTFRWSSKKIPETVAKNWETLKQSFSNLPRSVDKTIDEIINHLFTTEYRDKELEKFSTSYKCYEELLSFYKYSFLPVNFEDILDYNDAICNSFCKLIEWISPLQPNVLKADKNEYNWECRRMKDLNYVCQLYNKKPGAKSLCASLLKTISDVRYDKILIVKFAKQIENIAELET